VQAFRVGVDPGSAEGLCVEPHRDSGGRRAERLEPGVDGRTASAPGRVMGEGTSAGMGEGTGELPGRVIGRDAELRIVEAFLDDASRARTALLLQGEAGIGKTTVFREAVRRAAGRGFLVLVAQCAAAEAQLTLATLADLVEPAVDAEGVVLPSRQRAALDAALLRDAPEGRPLEPRLLGAATRSLLSSLAADRPVLVAIDDSQWVDLASSLTLAFALRRLPHARIGVLCAQRTGEVPGFSPASLGDTDRLTVIDIGPLTLAALHQLLKARLGHAPSRSVLVRISEASGGSPLFALEILRAIGSGPIPRAGEPLPVPADVRAIVRDRVRRLPRSTVDTLLLAATLGRAPVEVVERALGRRVDSDLEIAAGEGVARVEHDQVVFAHPLFAAAVMAEATPGERRAAHLRLAAVVAGDEERARHRALGSRGPTAAAAAELDAAAWGANARGAPAAAVELVDLALAMTPPDDITGRYARMLRLGELASRAGDTARATEVLGRVTREAADRRDRARAWLVLAAIAHEADAPSSAIACASAALADAAGDPELLARAHATLAAVDWDDLSRRSAHVAEALRLLDTVPDPDPVVLGLALMARCQEDVASGRPLDPMVVERALALEERAAPPRIADRFSASLGTWLKYLDDFDAARHWLERTYQAALDEGDDGSLAYALSHLPELELWTGDWERAEVLARSHYEIAAGGDLEAQRRQALYNLALVHAHQGRFEAARAEIADALAAAASDGDTWTTSSVLPLAGLVELTTGNAAAAVQHLGRASELRDAMGMASPRRHDQDLVDALLAVGDVAAAAEVVRAMETRAARFGRWSSLAIAARGRGLVAAAAGDLAGAAEALERALAAHERVPIPIDQARTLLAVGQVRRRRRERRVAKEAFDDALAIFERLGARPWTERTRAELARTGLRHAAGPGLTETERRVAELAAAGRTNREIAATLFISPKTVEANLARAYGKLDVTSRAELGALLGRVASPGGPVQR
jgi:DNA-binding CsgD family transcriptional regulator